MSEDCVFCKIVKGIKEEDKIYEDEEFVAFLDINPCAKGHLMLVPKTHYRWVWDLPDALYTRYLLKIKELAKVLMKVFNTDCVQEAIVGVDVEHAHIHLLPRTKEDGLGGLPTTPLDPKPSEKEMKKIAEKIKSSFDQS